MNWLKILFPGFRSARRALSHQPYFQRLKFLWSTPPLPYIDMPAEQIKEINQSSKKYFEDPANHEFWLNKPLSDGEWGPWFLWRFGLLLDCLQIRPKDRVLDFGCGTGWTSLLIAKIGADVTGMDIAPGALKIAEEIAGESKKSNLQFVEFDGYRIPSPDENFDFVIVFEAFHHLPNRLAILQEFHRVLAPHGILGFAEPGVGHSQAETAHSEQEKGVLEQDIDLEQLYRSALSVGFQDMEIVVPPVVPQNFTLPIRRLRWYMRGLSFLISADLIRVAMLTGPIGILRKGPYPKTSLHPSTLKARLRPKRKSIRTSPDTEIDLHVEIENLTDTVWLKEGRHGAGYVRAGIQLKQPDRKMIDRDYARSELPHDLRKNERVRLSIKFKAPHETGNYILMLDMVNEGVCWFQERGSEPVSVELIVSRTSA